tara:strand:+ start:57645 stop:60059 length:2415 start_codon:yes stop_codon:yes gene_type:complete
MKVVKRNGRSVIFNPSKITSRIRNRAEGLKVDADGMSIKVISQMADGITTTELDTLCIEIAASMVPVHPDYSTLASRLLVTQLRKSTPDSFSKAMMQVELSTEVLGDEFQVFIHNHKDELDAMIVQDRDFDHTIFGLRTLEKSYLLRDEKQNVIERPQYMWLRVAIEVGGFNMNDVIGSYNLMSQGYFTHATPTLFNAGTKLSQLSSCFLVANKGDSIDGLFDTMKDIAHISKLAGGIGLHIHDVRAKGSPIKGTNGQSDGIVPLFKTYNEVARWINQGGKRKGSFAMYLEPWHADFFEFIEMKKNHGKEEMRARDLFYAVWMNDLFMERVKADKDWSMFCPNILKKNNIVLQEVTGTEFSAVYTAAESMGLATKVVKARELWEKILVSQIETGVPYIGYKDRVNKSSNQKHLGTIKSSNLCIEINEFSSPDEQAVCNLASIALSKFVKWDGRKYVFDYISFEIVVRQAVRNLDNVIDANYYPTKETRTSNMKHRPIGLGVQGLADVFAMMKIPFDSPEARQLNKDIFEHMYYYALKESCDLADKRGQYESFEGSPASQGILQFDMYDDVDGECLGLNPDLDWDDLKAEIQDYGLRNSLLLALMPTASTSQILDNNECFEPFTSNLYTRGTLSGTYVISNKHLVRDLEAVDLWDDQMKNDLMLSNGSVMNIPRVPLDIKERYKTAYEISMKKIIDMAADRQRFICQAQSMNLFMTDITFQKLNAMHFYAWRKGLKTGMYYLRSKSAVDAVKVTANRTVTEDKLVNEGNFVPSDLKPVDQNDFKAMIERGRLASENDEDCEACGS